MLGSEVTDISGPVKYVDLRTTRIEELLRTLLTKEDLRAALTDFETRLGARIDDSRREARMLFEDVRGDIRLLAEHMAGLLDQRDP